MALTRDQLNSIQKLSVTHVFRRESRVATLNTDDIRNASTKIETATTRVLKTSDSGVDSIKYATNAASTELTTLTDAEKEKIYAITLAVKHGII